MSDQTPEPTEIHLDDRIGVDLHERGELGDVLDDALRHAALTGTGWIRIRFRTLEGPDYVPHDVAPDLAHLSMGDWILDAPDPTQVVEVVTVVAGVTPAEEDPEGSR